MSELQVKLCKLKFEEKTNSTDFHVPNLLLISYFSTFSSLLIYLTIFYRKKTSRGTQKVHIFFL